MCTLCGVVHSRMQQTAEESLGDIPSQSILGVGGWLLCLACRRHDVTEKIHCGNQLNFYYRMWQLCGFIYWIMLMVICFHLTWWSLCARHCQFEVMLMNHFHQKVSAGTGAREIVSQLRNVKHRHFFHLFPYRIIILIHLVSPLKCF